MNESIYFDDGLPAFAALTLTAWGEEALEKNLFLRDADGRLTLVVLDGHSTEDRESLSKQAVMKLGNYVDVGFAVSTPDELFDDRLKTRSSARESNIKHRLFTGKVWLVDRRLIGADWLLVPSPARGKPRRVVFASIKGGVGRSTALCVLASFLAFRGKRVLTVDMDLEAPGLGNMLLPGDTLPNFGLLDYLVEQHIGKLDDEFFADMTGASWLGAGRGRVDVIPALGRRSLENPANVLAKIARAYLPGASSDSNEVSSFTDHVSALLDRVALPSKYDVVLIDARAGLHETSAAAVIGLGAEVLLFGVDQAQTLAGYELLFSHLATLPVRDGNDWKDRLTLIQAKASDDHKINSEYAEKIGGLMKKYLWPVSNDEDVEKNLSELEGEFETEWDDESNVSLSIETPLPIIIPESPLFHRFDPVRDGSTLEVGVYKNTFGSFLNTVSEILDDGND